MPRENDRSQVDAIEEEYDQEEQYGEDVMTADVSEVLQMSSTPPEVVVLEARTLEVVQDHSKGVVDTAAARSVAGGPWTSAYFAKLDALGLSHLTSRTM